MESIDRGLQQRVWQRVRSEPEATPAPAPAVRPGPEGFLLEELTDGALLQRLATTAREPRAGALRQAAALYQGRSFALRGLCRLADTTLPSAPKPSPIDNPDAVCRRVLGNLLRRIGEYEKLRSHPEYGAVYGILSAKAAESAYFLTQAMGK